MSKFVHKNKKFIGEYKYGFSKPEESVFKTEKGLDEQKIIQISKIKREPKWMLEYRLKAYKIFLEKKMPTWGADLSEIDFSDIFYYLKPTDKPKKTWEDLPDSIKETYDRLGIPEAERKFLAGVSAQYESEVVYHSLIDELRKQGVIFTDMDTGLKEYEDLVKKYFGTLVPPSDNKFAALNSAVWSGGSFVYVPKGVKVSIPLQAYFRINAKNMGQFERTLIIAEEDSFVHYIEGCFLAGARVRAKTGEKRIEEIKIGDEVLTHTSKFKKVYNVTKRLYSGKVYKIKLWGNSVSELNITEDHPLLIAKEDKLSSKNIRFNLDWHFANNLQIGDYLVYPRKKKEKLSRDGHLIIQKINSLITKEKDCSNTQSKNSIGKEFFYILGYFYSKGHIENESTIKFTFDSKDNKHLKLLESLCKKLLINAQLTQQTDKNEIILTIIDPNIANFFLNEVGKNDSEKVFQDWVSDLPEDSLKELIKGMWIGKGWYEETSNLIKYSTNNSNLALGFYDSLLHLGIISTLNQSKNGIYTVIVSKRYNSDFGKIVGYDFKSSEIDEVKLFMDENYLYLPVKSIKECFQETIVYNLSVEEDETYVAEGVISHNCTAPVYSSDSLHAAVVEIFCKKNSRVRYTTIQNWAPNVYNLVTKRAIAEEGAIMEWIDGNIGSKKTMKYPSIILKGEGSKGVVVSAAYAGKDQHQDTGTKIYLLAPNTSVEITSKSVSQYNGRTTYRGIVSISKRANNSKVSVKCDALLLDNESKTDTIPINIVNAENTEVEHEASVSRVKEIQLHYLQSRGISEDESGSMIVNGFMDAFTKELPMEYAVELNRLISMNMEGSVG